MKSAPAETKVNVGDLIDVLLSEESSVNEIRAAVDVLAGASPSDWDSLGIYVPALVERALEITDRQTRGRLIQVIQFAPPADALQGLQELQSAQTSPAQAGEFEQGIVRLQSFIRAQSKSVGLHRVSI